MQLSQCRFETARLLAQEWRSAPGSPGAEGALEDVVAGMLTECVTATLPPDWDGPYTRERAGRWIEARDAEGTTLLVQGRSDGGPVGLFFIHDTGGATGGAKEPEVRIGYLLAESHWGQGLATELLAGFVAWCRAAGEAMRLVAGLTSFNAASAAVLEKNGFRLSGSSPDGSEHTYELRLP